MRTEEVIEILSQNVFLHMDMIDSLQKGMADILSASEQGVLLYNRPGECYMISSEHESEADKLIDLITAADVITVHQDFYREKLQNKFALKQRMDCLHALYLSKQLLVLSSDIEIRQLDSSHIPVIVTHYKQIPDETYIRNRMQGGMYGAFYDSQLAGFIGTHAEGSMGMLVVLPEFRRRGIATALESYMINRVLAQGFIPYAQITLENTASLALQQKLNLTLSQQVITWLY